MRTAVLAATLLCCCVVTSLLQQAQALQFQGTSYAQYAFETGYTQNSISLTFRTRDEAALLLFIGPDSGKADYLSIVLVDGRVVVSFDLGGGETLLSSEDRYDDGFDHTVFFRRQALAATLRVDDSLIASATAPGTSNTLSVAGLDGNGIIFLGGLNPAYSMAARSATSEFSLAPGLNGCVLASTVDGTDLLAMAPMQQVQVLSDCGLPACSLPAGFLCPSMARPICSGTTASPSVVCECDELAAGGECNFIVAAFTAGSDGIGTILQDPIATETFTLVLDVNPSVDLQDADLVTFSPNPAVPGDTFELSLVAGRLLLSYSLGSGTAITIADDALPVDQWSRVWVQLNQRTATVTVDDTPVATATSNPGSTVLNIPAGAMLMFCPCVVNPTP
ncbi:hypothetical protein PTSG_05398 [Salpingoeca rosetta]|uniref:Laminin G domain-containing protein n=1 Tax=Salpingoeca rosetta (strain ATCC 50818 / BSB-021) TaxID=946362 RepID=F2UAB5_SALR5|nr:uncharacterized protein PTSG_05398 [Salpingoeca rosetta]EGD73690.1 hypothetical protein PTSG_05398 [Salpingoeca rosetta]|eukprot:XP_004993971.1 hypothetical protein PTSG_05398 [Salpingoeca rosetta]